VVLLVLAVLHKALHFTITHANMAFNTQEQEIIKWGLQNGKSQQDVTQAITNFRTGVVPPKPAEQKQSFLQDVKGDFLGVGRDILSSSQKRADTITGIRGQMQSGQKSDASAIFQTAGQVAGAGADAIGSVFKGAVKLALTPKGEQRTMELVSSFGQEVVQRPETQKLISWYEGLSPETQDNLDAAGGFASLASEFIGVGVGKRGATALKEGASTVTAGIRQGAGEVATETFALGKSIVPKSPEIMNRVARLTPNQARKFKALAGESHGEYLTKTGNFGSPQEIVEKEAIKFSQSVKSVDETLDTLQGTFKAGVIDDVLEGLTERVNLTSSKNVPSPISKQVSDLVAKNANEGLTMTDVNVMKRLYEREVKLGYNKMMNPDKVQTATNIDSALREWQVGKAEELGFSNLKELNKQTQISKNLINSLGDEVVGKTGLNNVNLTDWIMLSGGDPTAIGGFLTKKFFGSKKVQAKIAEMLSEVNPPEGIKKPMVTPSKQTPLPQQEISKLRASPKTTPPPNFSKGEIPTSKKSRFQSAKDNLKNPKNAQGGFIKVPGAKEPSKPITKSVSSPNSSISAKEAIAKGMTEEQYVKGVVKEPLEAGIDRKNLSSAYRVGSTDTYVLAKKTGKTIPRETTIMSRDGKEKTIIIGRGPEIEYRIANFDPKNDPNLYNAYLRAKKGTTNLKEIESQLRAEYQAAKKANK